MVPLFWAFTSEMNVTPCEVSKINLLSQLILGPNAPKSCTLCNPFSLGSLFSPKAGNWSTKLVHADTPAPSSSRAFTTSGNPQKQAAKETNGNDQGIKTTEINVLKFVIIYCYQFQYLSIPHHRSASMTSIHINNSNNFMAIEKSGVSWLVICHWLAKVNQYQLIDWYSLASIDIDWNRWSINYDRLQTPWALKFSLGWGVRECFVSSLFNSKFYKKSTSDHSVLPCMVPLTDISYLWFVSRGEQGLPMYSWLWALEFGPSPTWTFSVRNWSTSYGDI